MIYPIYPTFEEWERHQDPEQPADEEAAWNAACMVRDAEIADLKRQLAEAHLQSLELGQQIAVFNSQRDAYVQERVDAARAKAFEQCRQLLLAQGSDVCANGAAIFAGWRDDAAKVKT